jgi:isoleucyl-tRNA synthetase
MFEPFDPLKTEKDVLGLWEREKSYERVRKSKSGGKPFFFADGPPYATGNIHMGTGWNKIIKDTYIRFWRMQGFDVWDQPGYDTHGTPIEHQVEKQLGFSAKKDIEAYGAGRFIAKCREFATKYIGVMNSEFANLGVWMDWGHPYVTLDNSYIEGAWFTFERAHEKGLLYKGLYPVHVCPRCGTAVSYNEIEYQNVTDDSVYVKFPLVGREGQYLLIWTTTPWTLPANTGVMVHPRFSYSLIETPSGDKLVMAKELAAGVMEKAGIKGWKEVDSFSGDDLSGVAYDHPLKDLVPCLQELEGAHRVVASARYVTLDAGTGLVHTAPGHGSEDYQVGVQEGLPMLSPVAMDGTFTKDAGPWLEGKFVKDADPLIIQKLSERNMLLKKEPITHEYPMCWRCNSALIQISVPQWFFKITEIRDKLLQENARITWVPDWAGSRFRNWLQSLADWPVSRQRYWGIPLPIWECTCGTVEVVGSFAELKKRSGLTKEIDFHRPEIDDVRLDCPSCGRPMSRTPDVLDVWFDSGVSTWAALEYPRKKALFGRLWPSTFQTEGPDQFRGWWNSQMITSVLTFGKSPFRTIMLHGFVLDAKGAKMSKSKGNVVTPAAVVEKYGRDVLRFYLMGSPPWEDFYFSWDSAKEASRLFNVFWNVFQFTKTYAPKAPKARPDLRPEDRWIISRVNTLLEGTEHARKYMIHRLVAASGDFILNDLSRWYVKLVRDRLSPGYEGKDMAGAEYALHYVLDRLVRIVAPVAPFMTERIYQALFGGRFSVHAEPWPERESRLVDKELEEAMAVARELVEAMNSLREEKGLKLKWPLDAVHIHPKDHKVKESLERLSSVVCSMGNVQSLRFLSKSSGEMKPFSGGKLGLGEVLKEEAAIRELVRSVQILRKESHLDVRDSIRLQLEVDPETEGILKRFEADVLKGTGSSSLEFGPVKEAKGSAEVMGRPVRIGFRKA